MERRGRPSTPPDDKRCQAKSKQTGKQCKNYKEPGMNTCRIHGGKSPRGRKSANYKHGRYSNYIPDKLLDRYEAMLHDEEIYRMREEIAVLRSRFSELLEQVEDGENPTTWREFLSLWESFSLAVQTGDVEKQRDIFIKIDDLAGRAANKWEAWKEIRSVAESTRKLIESEHRRLVAEEHIIAVDKVMVLLDATISALRDAVYMKLESYPGGYDVAREIVIEASRQHERLITDRLGDESRKILAQ